MAWRWLFHFYQSYLFNPDHELVLCTHYRNHLPVIMGTFTSLQWICEKYIDPALYHLSLWRFIHCLKLSVYSVKLPEKITFFSICAVSEDFMQCGRWIRGKSHASRINYETHSNMIKAYKFFTYYIITSIHIYIIGDMFRKKN